MLANPSHRGPTLPPSDREWTNNRGEPKNLVSKPGLPPDLTGGLRKRRNYKGLNPERLDQGLEAIVGEVGVGLEDSGVWHHKGVIRD